jgi:hypothetical protein
LRFGQHDGVENAAAGICARRRNFDDAQPIVGPAADNVCKRAANVDADGVAGLRHGFLMRRP